MISIIIPVYNVEKFLAECLDSVLGQTYRELEVIVVDDGSTDQSPAICDAYAAKDDRIIVIHQKNTGLSGARNTGLDAAKGEYVAFLDSDDRYASSDVIEKMYKSMTETQADLLLSVLRRMDETGNWLEQKQQRGICEVIEEEQFWGLWTNRKDDALVVVYTKLYKRKLWETLRFPVGKINEDEWVLHHVIGASRRIVLTDLVSIDYRQRSSSIMHTGFSRKNMGKCEALAERMDYFMEKGLHQYEPQLFAEGTVVLLLGYAKLDWHKDREARQDIRRYYQRYRRFAKVMLPRTKGKTQKIRLWTFTWGLGIYRFVRNWITKHKI